MKRGKMKLIRFLNTTLKISVCIGIMMVCFNLSSQLSHAGSDNLVAYGSTEKEFNVVAHFRASHKCSSSDGFTLKEGKHVKMAMVKAKSEGLKIFGITVCSSSDSGWIVSKEASSIYDNTIYSTGVVSVGKCFTCKQITGYDWRYFD